MMTTPNGDKDTEKLVEIWAGTVTVNTVWKGLNKLNMQLPYDPVINPREMEINIYTKMSCTWMFIAALFILAKNWRQSRCTPMGKSAVVYLYYGILFSKEKEWAVDLHDDLEEPQGYYAEWNKQISKGNRLCDSTDLTFFEMKIF